MELLLCCLTTLSSIFHLYRGGHVYWWRKYEYPEEILITYGNAVWCTPRHAYEHDSNSQV